MKPVNSRIFILVILIVFLLIVTSLGANVANLRKQNLNATTQSEPNITNATLPFVVGNNNNDFLPMSPSLSGVWYLVVAFVILAAVVAYAFTKSHWNEQPSSISQLLALLIILAFLVLIYEASIRGIGTYLGSSQSPGAFFLIYVLIASAAFGFFLLFWRYDVFLPFRKFSGPSGSKSRVTSDPKKDKEGAKNALELKSILDNAVSLLYRGEDYRFTIIRCYKAVLSLLERNGMPERPTLTAREFEMEISSRLGLSASGDLHDLTYLFERARYSNEPTTSMDASAAEQTLNQMSSKLSNVPEGAENEN